MSSTINASTTSGLVSSADLSGVIELQANGSTKLTVNSTGAVLPNGTTVAGNGPAFSAYQNVSVNLATSTFVKMPLQTEEFDTANAFDATTNYRFQPLVAGYYQINGAVNLIGAAGNNYIVSIYKNGTEYKRGNQLSYNPAGNTQALVVSLVYLNGSTDYVELYGYQNSGSTQTSGASSSLTYFNGFLARAA